jgi:murein DD-endopeptidase MepM/ murein hydrolase activator NlpD
VVQFAGLVARVRYVVVAHPSGLRSTYGRLAESTVKEGDTVSPGQVLGRSGTRVFFGIRHGTVYLDPTRYLLRRVGSPRLVPTDGSPARPPDPARRPAGRLSCTARSPGR